MEIVIESLSRNAARQMIEDCTEKIFEDMTNHPEDGGVIDVTINPSVIMKVYDDEIFFDLGGKLTTLYRCQFFTITIE